MARRGLADIVVAVACALGASSLLAACLNFDQLTGGDGSLDASSDGNPFDGPSQSDASGDASQTIDAADAGLCAHTAGSDMVNVAGSFCIDSTEVSCGEYSDFLSSSPSLPDQIPECQGNASFLPTGATWPCAASLPVAGVNWCDAVAYCKSAGKRLCGAIGGGPTAFADFANAATSEWTAACTHGGTQSYPYGASYQPGVCDGLDHDAAAPVPVGSLAGCQGGYPGIFDMSGNLSEWEDSCEGDASTSNCRLRSGSWYSGPYDMTCTVDLSAPRMTTDHGVGFRCCAP